MCVRFGVKYDPTHVSNILEDTCEAILMTMLHIRCARCKQVFNGFLMSTDLTPGGLIRVHIPTFSICTKNSHADHTTNVKNMHPHRDSNPGPWITVPML